MQYPKLEGVCLHVSLAALQHYEVFCRKAKDSWVSRKELIEMLGLRDTYWIDEILCDWEKVGLVKKRRSGNKFLYSPADEQFSLKEIGRIFKGFVIQGDGSKKYNGV